MQRWMRVCAVLVSVVVGGAARAEESRVVILRGDPSANQPLAFVADEKGLDRAQIGGVSGAELLALKGQRLLEQAEVYRKAQAAAGVKAPGPLYVVLEPAGTWAFAAPWGTFRYERDGKAVGPVTTPFLRLGEKMDHASQVTEAGEEAAEINRALIGKARAFYEAELKTKKVKRIPDFERDVLDRMSITIGGGMPQALSKAATRLSSKHFLAYMKQVLVSELTSYGLDGNARFAAFEAQGATALVEEGNRASLKRAVAETVAHELGHVIQFAALGLYQYKGAYPGIHMNGSQHTLQTLSTPEFALVEGWGEANSMVVVGLPRERSPGEANRINYGTTADYLPAALNDRVGKLVSGKMHKDGLLKDAEPLMTPALNTDPAQFRTALRATALKAGMKEETWTALAAEIDADADVRDLKRAGAYVAGLQARQGQLRSRYDFLRSEYAVANALAKLRVALGFEASAEVCETLARHKSQDLASLIEAFVHDHPARRLDTYRVLAQATEGILVTPAQVAAIEEAERTGAKLEIDFDQDGRVPGRSANAALPAVFPRDMPAAGEEPLPAPRTNVIAARATEAIAPAAAAGTIEGSATETVVLAPPAGDRTIPAALEPDMDGLERM